jgi:ArsR family transcriptional regulator
MDKELTVLDRTLKALADPTRVRMLALLGTGDICVCHIHESLGITQSKASRHLAYLRRAGLVATEKRGLWVYYRRAPAAHPAVQAVLDAVGRGLAQIPTLQRDRSRLEKKLGCCAVF